MIKTLKNGLMAIIAFTIIGLASCKKTPVVSKKDSDQNVYVYQNGVVTNPDKRGITQIKKDEFAIRFVSRAYNSPKGNFYSTQIAAFKEETELPTINIGMSTANIPCFEPGSGMAPSSSGFYESIIFNNDGHHYLYYENSGNRRVTLISKDKDLLTLEFPIKELYLNELDVKIKNADLNKFYLLVLIDENLNKIVEEGELTRIAISFE